MQGKTETSYIVWFGFEYRGRIVCFTRDIIVSPRLLNTFEVYQARLNIF